MGSIEDRWGQVGTPISINAHASRHQNGGADEVSVTGLSGLLADDQHVLDAEVTAVAVALTLFDAHTVLIAISDNTPVALTVNEQSVVGRITGGNIVALTGAQLWTILTGQAGTAVSMNSQNLTNLGTLTATNSIWWRESHMAASSANPGASGATFVPADANTIGGYQLNAATEILQCENHAHADWDAASDLIVTIDFEVNVDNTAGLVGDTVDLKSVFRYKGSGETAIKTQTVEVATVVGQSARYKQFTASFTIDYDLVDNVVEVDDVISMQLNLETDTSEVDDVIINHMEFKYKTKKPAPEV